MTRAAVGEDEIPVLVREDGSTLAGEDEILRWLDGLAAGSAAQEEQHRAKALDKAGLPG